MVENHLKNEHEFGKLSQLKEELTISRRSESHYKESKERIAAELANLKREFICDECDHQAKSTSDLRRHLKKYHNVGSLNNQDQLKDELHKLKKELKISRKS